MRALMLLLVLIVGAGCETEAQKKRQEENAKREAKRAAATQARRDRLAWLWANKHYNEDHPPFVVLEVRASHLLSPVETTIEKSGAPAVGAAAGGGTAALLGFGPVGVVVAGALGAAALSGGSSVQQVSTDSTTCVIIGEDPEGKIKTLTFQTSENKDWTGICLSARPGDKVFFRAQVERVWWGDEDYFVEEPSITRWKLLLEAKPPK